MCSHFRTDIENGFSEHPFKHIFFYKVLFLIVKELIPRHFYNFLLPTFFIRSAPLKSFLILFSPPADYNLEIRDVRLEDDGTYECQILQLRSPAAAVIVHVPPENPSIEGGAVREVIEARTVQLRCEARGGKPAPQVSWKN